MFNTTFSDFIEKKMEGVWDEVFLVPRKTTTNIEVGMMRMQEGGKNKRHSHREGVSTVPGGGNEGEGDEVMVVLEGKGVIEIEGEERPLEKGMVVFIPQGAMHQTWCDSPEGICYLFATAILRPEG